MLPLHTVRVTRQSMGMATIALLTACTAEPRVPSRPLDSAAETDVVKQIPGPAATPARSPDAFRVAVETSKGTFTIAVQRALAPRGADRFFELVTAGYFTDVRFFRVVPGFVVQFGMHGDPAVNALWERATLLDEPRRMSNTRGTVAFAAAGPNTRTMQLFVNTADNGRKLDGQRLFAPIGSVMDGMDVVDKLNNEYGEEPNPPRIASKGNVYLQRWFPALDYIKSATIIPLAPKP